jgi:acyl-CoA thioesterase-1
MHRERFLILGDSITVGSGFSGVDDSTCFLAVARRQLANEGLPYELVASALDGVDTGYALRRFDRMVRSHEPAHVAVFLGSNDATPAGCRQAASPTVFLQNLRQLCRRIERIGANPWLVTPIPRFEFPRASQVQCDLVASLATTMRQLAGESNIPCIDAHRAFSSAGPLDQLLPDGIHPDAAGHVLIGTTFVQALLQAACSPSTAFSS